VCLYVCLSTLFRTINPEPEKMLHEQSLKVLWKAYREPRLTWSNFWENMSVKQKPKVVMVVVVVVVVDIVVADDGCL